jgi:hypothetical protein
MLLVLLPLSCGKRERVVDAPPTAVGGGPWTMTIPAPDARAAIARARCQVFSACDAVESDACITREEAALPKLPCAVDASLLQECLERTRARACTDATAPSECAGEVLCPKEEQP